MKILVSNIQDATSLKQKDIIGYLTGPGAVRELRGIVASTELLPAEALLLTTKDLLIQTGLKESDIDFILFKFVREIQTYAEKLAMILGAKSGAKVPFLFLAVTDNRWVTVYPDCERTLDLQNMSVIEQVVFTGPPVVSWSVNLGALFLRNFSTLYGLDYAKLCNQAGEPDPSGSAEHTA